MVEERRIWSIDGRKIDVKQETEERKNNRIEHAFGSTRHTQFGQLQRWQERRQVGLS